jgi:hypothetical protein
MRAALFRRANRTRYVFRRLESLTWQVLELADDVAWRSILACQFHQLGFVGGIIGALEILFYLNRRNLLLIGHVILLRSSSPSARPGGDSRMHAYPVLEVLASHGRIWWATSAYLTRANNVIFGWHSVANKCEEAAIRGRWP